jgi:hypothetical protein
MKPEGSLLPSEELNTEPYSKLVESNPHPHTLFL